ncbi:translation initiation factor IF-2 N-terminal domain-containing protein [uncultured Clostridium sp.]|uniref:translation initiation factor IF-2 N-terminal domain-containing protein n=1 Tax=uncultured Clostridium sp. TaxID=59620 RepID=UPI0025DA4A90|nr:translation initiation factor IF-2 N-terminal domain-containing protein [uncultured Clostridium sp.]
MEYVRVYELAKQYGLTNEQMINFLINNGIDVATHMSAVRMSSVSQLMKLLEGKTNFREHTNKTSLKRIKIEGLFGKYDYDIEFKKDISIWVAENGQGKTTILNILVALLNGDVKMLANINFQKIVVYIGQKSFVLDKGIKKNKSLDKRKYEQLLFEIQDVMPYMSFRHMLNKYRHDEQIDYNELTGYIKKYIVEMDGTYRNEKLFYLLNEIQELELENFAEKVYEIKNEVIEEPLFYPTYRRIEVSIDKVFLNNKIPNDMTKYIKFGMRDVKKRVNALLKKMSSDANTSYIQMNGEVISDLLKGASMEELTRNIAPIDKHKVEVIIKRIGEERIENIDKLKSFVANKEDHPNEEFLKFYLNKLVKIYDSQRAIDEKLSKFAKVCTKYLAGKKVVYDEVNLSVCVFDANDDEIDFDDLSSGEKQIVSIFSKVYLDVMTSCIFIIDEPELSLSIEWQKEFLIDIYNSGKVGLLIGTTHSPFIFKNEFRNYTVEMDLYKREK